MNLSIISCTNRPNSLSLQLAAYYQILLQKKQLNPILIDLGRLPEDFLFSALYEKTGTHPGFNRFQEQIDHSDKLILIVPEYNGSFPGILKAFIDGLRYPDTFQNKKIALTSLSSGPQGGLLALSHLADIFSYLQAEVMSLRVKIPFASKNLAKGVPAEALYRTLIEEQLERFARF